MADLRRVPVAWTTGPGGVGLSVFYTDAADDATAALGTFFNAIKGLFPPAVSWSIPSAGDQIDDATGALTGAWSGGTAASITGAGSGTWAAGTGMYVRWLTGGLRNSRKFQGRTFLCPVASGGYATDGTLDAANQAAVQTAVNTLAGTGLLQLWGRPIAPSTSNGVSGQIIAGVVPDKVTSLHSRRS